MAKTLDYKLWPALEGLGTLRFKPANDLSELYEELLHKAMKRNGFLKNPEDLALIALQDWSFGKITKQACIKKLDKLDYIEWEIV